MTTTGPSRRVFLGLGSNLGEREAYLRGAIDARPDLVRVSDAYETDPIGGPEQGAFLNIVAELQTSLTEEGTLKERLKANSAAEAVRDAEALSTLKTQLADAKQHLKEAEAKATNFAKE